MDLALLVLYQKDLGNILPVRPLRMVKKKLVYSYAEKSLFSSHLCLAFTYKEALCRSYLLTFFALSLFILHVSYFLQFVNVEAPLTASQIKVYDTAVHVWYV